MEEPIEKIRVLIVDDSPFSRQLIANSLDSDWFEIVGFADGFRSALESYRTCLPDVVTMDIDLPEMDGLEITQRILAEEPSAKIIIISNVNDKELVEQARSKGAAQLIQRPFESSHLMSVLRNVYNAAVTHDVFKNCYPAEFIDSFTTFMRRFSPDILVEPLVSNGRAMSSGLAVLIGITGRFSGRMTLDLSTTTAQELAGRFLKQAPANVDQRNDVVAELANIIAGNASSKLNNKFRGALLRVAPPTIFSGTKFSIVNPNLNVCEWMITTPYGEIQLSVGFKKEEL